MLKCLFKISLGTQDKQLWASIKTFPFKKMENGSRAKNDHIKARLKPNRKTLPVTNNLCPASYMSSKGCQRPCLYGFAACSPHCLSSGLVPLVTWGMYQKVHVSASQISWEFHCSLRLHLHNFTYCPLGLPAEFQLSYILPGLPDLPLKSGWNPPGTPADCTKYKPRIMW